MNFQVKIFLLVLFCISYSAAQVRINEFMSTNSLTLTDIDGDYSDWIEIYNNTSSNVNLSGWSLTDDENDSLKWIFPDAVINANGYLIVFASGKNLKEPQTELHTNFKLAAEGEYLALFDAAGSIVSEFEPYPRLDDDISYGYYDDYYFPFSIPTPGEENQLDGEAVLPSPEFTNNRGFYETPFNLEVSADFSNQPGGQGDAKIFYTTDGSEPGENNGTEYVSPVLIYKSTVFRAITIRGNLQSNITTSSFLFLEDIINQPDNPLGYPSEWGKYIEMEGTAVADYGMDPEVTTDPQYSGFIKDALLSIPTISIVTDKNNLFSHSTDPDSGGIYIYTGAPSNGGGYEIGKEWERPASVEYFKSNSPEEFQIDCGLKIHGGHSRRPEKTPKHSFRIFFKSEYGESKLNYPFFGSENPSSFNSIVFRAAYGNTWLHRNSSERNHAQLIHDLWAKDTQLDMGNPAGQGFFTHLYLNGIYWGVYNLTERIDNDYGETYFGGNEEDYDVIKDYAEVANGNKIAWDEMMDLADEGLEDNVNYQRIQGKNPDGSYNPEYEAYLDIVNFIDYMIVNFYAANSDWDHHNWVAVRNRINPGKGFKFFCWDAERILENVSASVLSLNHSNRPSGLFKQLSKNKDFRRLFADRVQLHCFSGGALTPEASIKRWMKRAEEIDLAIIAESARWGDYRRDVHSQFGPFDLYTKEHWLTEQSFLINNYFPDRTSIFINQLKEADLFPDIDAPRFLINDQPKSDNYINRGDMISISSGSGTVYYTIDNSDPVINGEVSPDALIYSGPFELNQSIHIKARTFYGDEWSALSDIQFIIHEDTGNLKITEIHYHPLPEDTIDDNNFEFIEIKNIGSAPIQMADYKFIEGISFTFLSGTVLNPGEFIVLASDKHYFEMRYSFAPFDEFNGALDNSGERIVFVNPVNDTVFSIRYNDKDPWPVAADGEGYSLVLSEENPAADQDNAELWRKSFSIHGSPGSNDLNTTNINSDELSDTNPEKYLLLQNYPNPFNPKTVIGYQLTAPGYVTLKVYDILGREVATLVNEEKHAGKYKINFDAGSLSSGIYFYQLKADSFIQTKKLILLK